MNEFLIPSATLYIARNQLELAGTLGSGKDGTVLVAERKAQPAKAAMKLFRLPVAYDRERAVYERLRTLGVDSVLGFNIPQLLGSDDQAHILEMTIVERPFVLDFAGAYLDQQPQFPEDVWADWEAEKREQFEERWPQVQRVLNAFEAMGVFLLDVSPGNIAFQS